MKNKDVYHVDKPWGWEKIWAKTPFYVGKMIYIRKGCRLSFQYHERKTETIYIVEGQMTLVIGDEKEQIEMSFCDSYHIPSGLKHRFWAPDMDCLVMEVSTSQLDDVQRLEDDFDRINSDKNP